jgi:hypothetical protein
MFNSSECLYTQVAVEIHEDQTARRLREDKCEFSGENI